MGTRLLVGPSLPSFDYLFWEIHQESHVLALVGTWRRAFYVIALAFWNIIAPEIILSLILLFFHKALKTWVYC